MLTSKLKEVVPEFIKQILRTLRQGIIYLKITENLIASPFHAAPIFILGNQKSGTSAIAALLAELTALSAIVDLKKEIENPTYHRVKIGELSFAEFVKLNRLDFSKDIIKEPNLTLLYQELNDYFPRAKFVFVIRDPRDNIRSMLDRLQIPGNLSQLDQNHWQKITPAWELIINNQWLGIEGENYIEMLAGRWNYTTNIFWQHQDKMILTRYEDFLQDKIGELVRIANELGLKPLKDITDKVDIQFQPRGNREVKWEDFFGNENLRKIELICGDKMKLFGYQIHNQK